jgi:uncharacterized membrane protein YheB (UPF0754 family)
VGGQRSGRLAVIATAATGSGSILVLLTMPLAAALIGFVTKLVAVEMMFRPIKFRGIRPPFGWQGMVPRRAAKMASIAVDTLTGRLLKPQDLLDEIDPYALVASFEGPLREVIDDVAADIAALVHPELWTRLPEAARRGVVDRVRQRIPSIVAQVLDEVRGDIDALFDLKYIVVSNLVRDKVLLNQLFRELARPEMQFIIRSGLVFGLGIGLIQAFVWAATREPIVMPLFGLMVGWSTDWLALTMIFRPIRERRLVGPLRWQGRFHRRRHELSAKYGEIMARDVLAPEVVLEGILEGPTSDRLLLTVQRAVSDAIDQEVGLARPVVAVAIGSARYDAIKRRLIERAIERMSASPADIAAVAESSIEGGVDRMIVDKMKELTVEEYEGILRPVFKEDEKILIAVGAVLGFLVGELQVVLVTHL